MLLSEVNATTPAGKNALKKWIGFNFVSVKQQEEQLQNDRDVVWKQVDDGVENGRNVMLFVIARQGVVETTPQLERLCQD